MAKETPPCPEYHFHGCGGKRGTTACSQAGEGAGGMGPFDPLVSDNWGILTAFDTCPGGGSALSPLVPLQVPLMGTAGPVGDAILLTIGGVEKSCPVAVLRVCRLGCCGVTIQVLQRSEGLCSETP